MPRGDWSTLPKWARDEKEKLERRIAELELKLAIGPKDSTAFMLDYGDKMKEIPLGKNPSLRFRFGKTRAGLYDIEVNQEKDHIEIRSRDGGVVIEPVVANAVRVHTRRFGD